MIILKQTEGCFRSIVEGQQIRFVDKPSAEVQSVQVTDAEVVRKCLRGDGEIFGVLVRKYQADVFRLCLWMVKNEEDAKDLASEAFVRAFERIRLYDRSRSFKTWLLKLASNMSIDFLRRRKSVLERYADPEQLETVRSPQAIAPDILIREECKQEVRDALQNLPDLYREVLVLRFFENLSYAEIAEMLKVPRGTVATLLFRAKALLRQRMVGNR